MVCFPICIMKTQLQKKKMFVFLCFVRQISVSPGPILKGILLVEFYQVQYRLFFRVSDYLLVFVSFSLHMGEARLALLC